MQGHAHRYHQVQIHHLEIADSLVYCYKDASEPRMRCSCEKGKYDSRMLKMTDKAQKCQLYNTIETNKQQQQNKPQTNKQTKTEKHVFKFWKVILKRSISKEGCQHNTE